MDANEVVAAVHRRDQLLREANALVQLARDVGAGQKEFGHREVYGTRSEKTFRPVAHSHQKRLAELAKEHAGELRADADGIMTALESRAQ